MSDRLQRLVCYLVGIMSDILAVFSIVAVSLAAITIVIRLLPLLMLAALLLLAVWSSFLRNRPQGSLVH